MKKKQKIRQVLLIIIFHIVAILWLVSGIITATTLN